MYQLILIILFIVVENGETMLPQSVNPEIMMTETDKIP